MTIDCCLDFGVSILPTTLLSPLHSHWGMNGPSCSIFLPTPVFISGSNVPSWCNLQSAVTELSTRGISSSVTGREGSEWADQPNGIPHLWPSPVKCWSSKTQPSPASDLQVVGTTPQPRTQEISTHIHHHQDWASLSNFSYLPFIPCGPEDFLGVLQVLELRELRVGGG